jgi:transposase
MLTSTPSHQGYPSDVCDDEWELVVPYLTLLPQDALQRRHDLRAVFNAARWIAHTGAPWRYLPSDFPPWPAVYQQVRRWLAAGSFEGLAHDLRTLLRVLKGRQPHPSAAILDARVIQSSPESGARAGYSGAKRRRGSKVHAAVDTLGHLLALSVTAASEDERTQVAALTRQVQAVTGQTVEVAFVDQGYTGEAAAATAAEQGIRLVVVKLEEAKHGFVLLPKRWVVERSFAWTARFRRLARDYERLPGVLAGLHFLAFACLMLHQVIQLYSSRNHSRRDL